MLTGLMAEEGFLMGYFLKEQLDQLPAKDIKDFMENFVVKGILQQKKLNQSETALKKLISHEYFGEITLESDRLRILNEIVDFFTDVYFTDPLEKQMDLMASVGTEIFYYINDFRSADIFGNKFLNRTSASHGSDLLYLFGPEMYKNFFNQDFQTFR
jgi:hypothetical protein